MSYIVKSLLSLFLFCSLPCFSSGQQQQTPIVWGVKESPYVRKVIVLLEEKKVAYQLNQVLPVSLLTALEKPIPEGFSKASPLGKIPALQDGAIAIADSAVIAAYLEKKYPEVNLYPKALDAYAKALWFEKYADTVMSEVIHTKIFIEKVIKPLLLQMATDEVKVQQAIDTELPSILDYLEQTFAKEGSSMLVGEALTIADIAVANHFVSLKMAGIAIDEKQWPLLSQYVGRVLALPSFQKALP